MNSSKRVIIAPDTQQQSSEQEKEPMNREIQEAERPQEPIKRGTLEEPEKIDLVLKYGKSNFPEAERAYFAAAAVEGGVSQTHFVNPEAEVCYRCPLCDKTLKPGGLAKNVIWRFLRLRNTPYTEYIIKTNDKSHKAIRAKTTNIATQRAGAEPPQSQATTNASGEEMEDLKKGEGRKEEYCKQPKDKGKGRGEKQSGKTNKKKGEKWKPKGRKNQKWEKKGELNSDKRNESARKEKEAERRQPNQKEKGDASSLTDEDSEDNEDRIKEKGPRQMEAQKPQQKQKRNWEESQIQDYHYSTPGNAEKSKQMRKPKM